MISNQADNGSRTLFGVPAVLAATERTLLERDLTVLWQLTYGQSLEGLEADLERCRAFFDPIARGHTLRARLAKLDPSPSDVILRMEHFGEPLVVDSGTGSLIVGIEARLLIDILSSHDSSAGHIVVSPASTAAAERMAMQVYRRWTVGRLTQVIDLRAGRGAEVMQAMSVGIVLALLVNRSDTPERAVVQWDSKTSDGEAVDHAVHSAADSFATVVGGKRGGRSLSEQKLKSGYALTEARRRLAHRLIVEPDSQVGGSRVFVPYEYRNEVVTFVARDLARRPMLEQDALETAFEQLVTAFRAAARGLAYRSMIFERAGDTAELKARLLDGFMQARNIS